MPGKPCLAFMAETVGHCLHMQVTLCIRRLSGAKWMDGNKRRYLHWTPLRVFFCLVSPISQAQLWWLVPSPTGWRARILTAQHHCLRALSSLTSPRAVINSQAKSSQHVKPTRHMLTLGQVTWSVAWFSIRSHKVHSLLIPLLALLGSSAPT